MFFQILKKDLKRKKTMNIILLIFIMLATMLLGSSINNVITCMRAVDYYIDKACVPDFAVLSYKEGVNNQVENWINSSNNITDYQKESFIAIKKQNLSINKNNEIKKYETSTSMLMIQKQSNKYMKVFDDDGNNIKINRGEAAIALTEKKNANLELGDIITFEKGKAKKEFKITSFVKDATFGTDFTDNKRIFINDDDYEELIQDSGIMKQYYYSMSAKDINLLQKDFNNQNINLFSMTKDMVKSLYSLEIMISSILIIVSLCLILMSFFILRFTIVFTLKNDYKEIGIMKAIGIKNFGIKSIYLTKYIFISLTASIIGYLLSFPVGSFLIKQASRNMLMENSNIYWFINLLTAVFIVSVVLIFCYLSTNNVNKLSVIEAIRNGSKGESFKRKSKIKLNNQRRINPSMYMAVNDIFSNFKMFITLIIIFCIGTILIVLPTNAINTLLDGSTVKLFAMPYTDIYIDTQNYEELITKGSKGVYVKFINDMEEKLNESNIGIKISGQVEFSLSYYTDENREKYSCRTYQSYNFDDNKNDYIEGSAPKLENEIALTDIFARKMNLNVGDSLYTTIDGEEKEFIITGLFECFNSFGEGARINNKIKIDYRNVSYINNFQGTFKKDIDKDLSIDKIKKIYPNYKIRTAKEYASETLGGSIDQMKLIKKLIIGIVIAINSLITILMMKSFISKERGEIAMLKSIGFRNSSIRFWQVFRIFIVLIVSIIMGIIISTFIAQVTVGQIFSVMGVTQINLIIVPKEVYVIYPILILSITSFMAFIASSSIKKIDLKEISNME